MLTKLTVKNFQSHEWIEVNLDPFVTSIVGDNDTGKTSLLRAFQILFLNAHRSPDNFVRNLKGVFDIEAEIDGHTVTRRKGKGTNLYLLDGKKFKFDLNRIRVPGPIANLLNLSRDNFALQHDQHFWFSDTAGAVSKRLNEILNLSAIDRSMKNVMGAVRRANGSLEQSKENLKAARHRIGTLERIPEFYRAAGELRKLSGRLETARIGTTEARKRAGEWLDTARRVEGLKIALRAGRGVVKMGKLRAGKRASLKRLKQLWRELRAARQLAALPVPDITALDKFRRRADDVAEDRRAFQYLAEDWLTARKNRCDLEIRLKTAKAKLARLAKNRTCPKCGRRLPSSAPTSTCGKKHR